MTLGVVIQATVLFLHRAILDGVDLDIEGGRPGNYAEFVKELRKLMSSDKKKKYIVSGAPQCPYPDAYLGPIHIGSALQGLLPFGGFYMLCMDMLIISTGGRLYINTTA